MFLSGKRDSNSRPQPWQGCALPTELFPRFAVGSSALLFLAKVGVFILPRGKVVLYQPSCIRIILKALHGAKSVLRVQI